MVPGLFLQTLAVTVFHLSDISNILSSPAAHRIETVFKFSSSVTHYLLILDS